MKQTTIFRQLIYNIVFPVIIALFVLGIFNFRTTRSILREGSQTRNFLISDEITQVLKFQDVAMSVLEDNLNPMLEQVSKKLVINYFVSTKNIANVDLNKVREDLKLEADLYDFYIKDFSIILKNKEDNSSFSILIDNTYIIHS